MINSTPWHSFMRAQAAAAGNSSAAQDFPLHSTPLDKASSRENEEKSETLHAWRVSTARRTSLPLTRLDRMTSDASWLDRSASDPREGG